MEIITKSAEETFKVGQRIGSSLKGEEIIALKGDLGAGKTTFVQGLAKGMGIKQKIISPTFILMRNYKGKVNLSHLDLYRIEGNIQEVRNLGLFDIFKEKNNVTVIEWGEKIKNILPKNTLWIEFKDIDHETRKVIIR